MTARDARDAQPPPKPGTAETVVRRRAKRLG